VQNERSTFQIDSESAMILCCTLHSNAEDNTLSAFQSDTQSYTCRADSDELPKHKKGNIDFTGFATRAKI
jgi:hypothetical protein